MSILRDCSVALAAALDAGRPMAKADLFVFTLANGQIYRWTSWDVDLVVGGQTYRSKKPWIKAGAWGLVETMQVPTLQVELSALNTDFGGGGQLKWQIHNGLFDGASMSYSRCYMPLTELTNTTIYGTIDIFSGVVGGINIGGLGAEIICKGGNNLLNQKTPRNVTMPSCLHTFCDPNCTLDRDDFTTAFLVGAVGITSRFVPFDTPPGDPEKYIGGTLSITSGNGAGQRRTIIDGDSSGLTLIYPLYALPAAGDDFTGFKGCGKTAEICETDYDNLQHFRGFPFIPPPTSTV